VTVLSDRGERSRGRGVVPKQTARIGSTKAPATARGPARSACFHLRNRVRSPRKHDERRWANAPICGLRSLLRHHATPGKSWRRPEGGGRSRPCPICHHRRRPAAGSSGAERAKVRARMMNSSARPTRSRLGKATRDLSVTCRRVPPAGFQRQETGGASQGENRDGRGRVPPASQHWREPILFAMNTRLTRDPKGRSPS
jgi:hypothetical protein